MLMPGSCASINDQWRTAWSLLTEDKDTPIEYRCHARCWLTYRAAEGHVCCEEYEKRVWRACEIPAEHPDAPRWITSQAAAEFYLWTLWSQFDRSKQAADTLFQNWRYYPPAVLSMLRVTVVQTYHLYLRGEHESAKIAVDAAISNWQQVMGSISWKKYPMRFMDGAGDMKALHALSCLSGRLGIVPQWITNHDKFLFDNKELWVRCIRHIGFIPEPRNRNDLGFFVPNQGVMIELGVARGNFSSDILRLHGQIGRLYAIDKWDDDRHPESEMHAAKKALTDKRAVIVHQTFQAALESPPFADNLFDLIYVDGYAHTGQENGTTLDQWWPKVKPGGIFAGHDYDEAWPLTVKAVDTFAKINKLCVNVINEEPYSSWWIKKIG